MHVEIPQNQNGRDYIIGDLHGCYDLLQKELSYAGFNPDHDRLFSVGDIIDRGPNSLKCLELLDRPWFTMVRGNHEQMMVDSILAEDKTDWASHYGDWADNLPRAVRKDLARRLDILPHALTLHAGTFQIGVCHAEPPEGDWMNVHKADAAAQMLWGRKVLSERPITNVANISITIHGHTPLDQPLWVGNRYFMDTGACETGTLTLRKIDDILNEYQQKSALFKS